MDLMYVAIIAVVVLVAVVALKGRNSPHRNGSTEQDITDALNDGNKIEAIKHYRYVHKVGLKEAKDAIDGMLKG